MNDWIGLEYEYDDDDDGDDNEKKKICLGSNQNFVHYSTKFVIYSSANSTT